MAWWKAASCPELDGQVALMSVPAEEYVELSYRQELQKAGKIEFLGGKQEFVRLGAFDDVQIAFSSHQSCYPSGASASVGVPSNGFVGKTVRFIGKAAHAAAAPSEGVNALRAAMLAMQAIDANRETFKDEDHVRVHPIITKGGELVNVIPADVRMETYVRGASVEAIVAANDKVDRCLRAGALAMGRYGRDHHHPGLFAQAQA